MSLWDWKLGPFLFSLIVLSTCAKAAEVPPSSMRANNQFAWDLYAKLAESPGNLVYSPESISSALAMTYLGAEGETAEQMARTLQFKVPADQLGARYASLLARFQQERQGENSRLTIVNRLWGQEGYEFRPEFLLSTREFFGAELGQVDFAKDSPAARLTINRWVADRTDDKIEDLLPPHSVNSLTRLVLTNAIYFLSDWETEFKKKATQPASFAVSANESVQTQLMFQSNEFKYANQDGVQVLELPYKTKRLSMIVLLPEKADGLAGLEQKLSAAQVDRWIGELAPRQVSLFLPRFKLNFPVELRDVLSRMGMSRAFSQTEADFTGIETSGELYLSAVVHQAFIEVDEQGTEAAAATAVVVDGSPAPPSTERTIEFRADHPFIYLVRDRETGSLLFIGRVANPSE